MVNIEQLSATQGQVAMSGSAPAFSDQCLPLAKVSATFDRQTWHTVGSRTRHSDGTEDDRADWSYSKRETAMPQPSTPEAGEQVPARPHDFGSAANETVDGLDATTEAIRHAAEDTPSGANPEDVEKTPVFDRAGQAPKI